uniref:anillin, actin binding protein 2 isoform X2 n=1 Tax=Doryrhamphus excisus TaxID=161450 RepID=UPI0025ADC632|nr:anillin, actin binding protein 2 isoform X2 [Doryrhamphus excisus]
MEAAEDNSSANTSLKRQRATLAETGDNLLSLSDVNDGQKRPRLESRGQENRTPRASPCGRGAELLIKPDTPMVPSVQQRVQQLAQKGDVAQHCLLDGSTSLSSKHHQHLLSEADFHQRMERFKGPLFRAGPDATPSPGKPRPLNLSNIVSGIQQKLHGDATPSSKQASRIRQEREQELNQLNLQPIRDNAWLKRSSSDSSLCQKQERTLPPSSCTPRSKRLVQWPPVQPYYDVDADMKDGSFTSGAHSSSPSGPGAPSEGRPPPAWKEQTTLQVDLEGGKTVLAKQPVLQLSFSEDGGVFSKAACGEDQKYSEPPAGDDDNVLESTRDESSADNANVSNVTQWNVWTGEDEKEGGSSCVEESMELSTEEESRVWRYPTCQGGDLAKQSEDRCCDSSGEESRILDADHLTIEASTVGKSACPHTNHGRRPSEELHCQDAAATLTSNIDKKMGKEAEVEKSQQDLDEEPDEKPGTGFDAKVENSVPKTLEETQALVGCRTVENDSQRAVGGEPSKKVTFILEPEFINSSTSMESDLSDVDLSSHDDTNTADIIDQMFEEVLEYAEKLEERRSSNEGEKDGAHIESEREEEKEEEEDQVDAKKEECEDELFLPTTSILSPLSKSIEAVVTPLRLDAGAEANPPSLLLTPDETTSPLYSVDAYRTQRQSKMAATIQSVTPRVQRRAPDKPQPGSSTNSKERIATLNEEAAKLQIVINQTLQALSCCTDEEHGRGSLEEAEAEKLLLVSCEKRSACLAEAARLRDGRSSSSSGEDDVTQQPCRATVTITNIQLPLKVEFVCSSYNRSAANHQPSHYFFILIRYGACNIVATPLATAADAQNGDTISFPTCVTLKDIASTFHIDVEVYSLSHTLGTITGMERSTARSRVTPRKLLNTLTKASSTLTSAAVPAFSTHRSSNFTLVGSHKITLASLGHRKFALDKVPFLSPLEGSIYLQVDSQSHSCVQHQGFLTMFELLSGFGVWHRRYFTLDGCTLHYWNHPNDKESKEAEGVISLSSSPNRCVRPVKRDSCARPFTFELVSSLPQDDNQESFSKRWFSADTKQERLDWMEKLNQALLDFHTWKPAASIPVQPSDTSRGNLRESIL